MPSLFDAVADPSIGSVANGVSFVVYGVAAPQGSAAVVNDNKPRLNDWRDAVRQRAQDAADRGLFFGQGVPLELRVTFYLPRPKRAPKRVQHQTTKPDALKLVRAVEDAMTSVLYHDDAQIVAHVSRKRFAIDSPPRAEIAPATVSRGCSARGFRKVATWAKAGARP